MSFSASVMASDEALQGIVCVARDITNRKQAEENAGALAKGPLTEDQLAEIDRVLGR